MTQTPKDISFPINHGRGDVEVTGLTGHVFIHTKNLRTQAPQTVLLTRSDREVMRLALDLADKREADWRVRNGY